MCADAGVKLMYLPPYSPDLNPIEEFFAELKAFIKPRWSVYEEGPDQGFDVFLDWCIDCVGSQTESARGTSGMPDGPLRRCGRLESKSEQ
jgi:DDE superfamily endonuclease